MFESVTEVEELQIFSVRKYTKRVNLVVFFTSQAQCEVKKTKYCVIVMLQSTKNVEKGGDESQSGDRTILVSKMRQIIHCFVPWGHFRNVDWSMK